MIRPGLWRRDFSVPLQTLQGELNRLIEGYWQPPAGSPAAAGIEPTDLNPAGWSPSIDLYETSADLVLVVDLPGVDPTSIDLSLTGSVLTLKGEKAASAIEDQSERTCERPSGAFHRQVALTEEVDFDRIQAEVKHGVLTIRLPKQSMVKARTIPVQSAD